MPLPGIPPLTRTYGSNSAPSPNLRRAGDQRHRNNHQQDFSSSERSPYRRTAKTLSARRSTNRGHAHHMRWAGRVPPAGRRALRRTRADARTRPRCRCLHERPRAAIMIRTSSADIYAPTRSRSRPSRLRTPLLRFFGRTAPKTTMISTSQPAPTGERRDPVFDSTRPATRLPSVSHRLRARPVAFYHVDDDTRHAVYYASFRDAGTADRIDVARAVPARSAAEDAAPFEGQRTQLRSSPPSAPSPNCSSSTSQRRASILSSAAIHPDGHRRLPGWRPGRRTVFVSTHLISEFEGLIDEFTIIDRRTQRR